MINKYLKNIFLVLFLSLKFQKFNLLSPSSSSSFVESNYNSILRCEQLASTGVDNYYNSPSFGFPFFSHFGANFVISKAPADESGKSDFLSVCI